MSAEEGLAADSARATVATPTEETRSPSAATRFTPGTLLAARYRIVAPLGRGGMGEVYRADDTRLGQPIALKFLPPALASEPGRLERLVDEVRIGRQISHPNVCRLYDIAEAGGHHFLVMEYVDGEDLASLLRRIGRLPGDKALEIARGICAGLAAAHDKGVIHRDLKPANVMIDGNGHARIADFGLAALVERGAARDMSGTPAYMAPEQLKGEGVTLRSDVFALGLVLSEMLTGQRVFVAKSLEELRALHAQSKPLSLSSSAKDVDPALEHVVQRCLASDPNERPASARVVLAMLPGGDPLQAAVLAGETPSPEMVAAAARVGDLRPSLAWSVLGCSLVSLVAFTLLAERYDLFRRVPLPKPPEALAERAKEVLSRLGHAGEPVDRAYGFTVSNAYIDYVERSDPSPARWDKLATTRPGPFRFFYRESPEKLVVSGWVPQLPWLGPPELARIGPDRPPPDVPGMLDVVLDPEGRLVRFRAVPPAFEERAAAWAEPDWSAILAEAGLDPQRLQQSAALWTAPVDSDHKMAWDGSTSERPDVALHIEAAAFHGRPVYFEVRGPWVRPPSSSKGDSPVVVIAQFITMVAMVPLVAAIIALVRRNIRLARSDRKGAFKLGLFTFATLTIAQAIRADHTSLVTEEYALIIGVVSQGCYGAFVVWALYMALEPALRRRWPHLLISWTRLLSGRFVDPLVGRDVLAGLALGIGAALTKQLAAVVPEWLGRPTSLGVNVLTTLSSARHVAYFFLLGLCLGVVYSVSTLFILYLLRAVVQRERLAQLLLFVFLFLPTLAVSGELLVGSVQAAFLTALILLALTRIGLLSGAILFFTFLGLVRAPLTFDWSAWYFGRSLVVLSFFATALVASFYLSLGGKPVFGRALLED
jgi:serine/threonine-protein kinase